MKLLFMYKLSGEVVQKFNFSSAWFFLFKSNPYFWFVWELVCLHHASKANVRQISTLPPPLPWVWPVYVFLGKLFGYKVGRAHLRIIGLRSEWGFCVSGQASVDLLPSTFQNNLLLDQGFASPTNWKKPPIALTSLGWPSRESEAQNCWRSSVC